MTDQVLTEDEKNALLDGVTSGAVEVQANGAARYASVREFDIGARSRIVSNSYPRLQSINQRFAERLSKQAAILLQCELEVRGVEVGLRSFSEFSGRFGGSGVAALFDAEPLTGRGLVVLRPELVGHLVEAFFGGPGSAGAGTGSNSFSAGELSVSNLFCDLVLATVQETWQSLAVFSPVRAATETGLDNIDLGEECDSIIDTAFELNMSCSDAEQHGRFHILWPRSMVAPLLPAFEGQRRDRDTAADASWERAIRRSLADASIRVSTQVGGTRLSLGAIVSLVAGDVLPIGSPAVATVLAGDVPVIRGRFGVLEGRNAVEAGAWLPAGIRTSSFQDR